MNREEPFVLTISREVGSGGHTVGGILAGKLGARYCDKQLLGALEKQFNLSAGAIEKLKGEKQSWLADFVSMISPMPSARMLGLDPRVTQEFRIDVTTNEIYKAEEEILKGFAEMGSCVIAGRSGFHVFKDHPNALKIFVHSSEDCRKRRIAEKYGLDLRDAAAMVVDNDYSRELYTKTYTGCEWFDARNYDISLDVRKFGINGAVDFLMKCIE